MRAAVVCDVKMRKKTRTSLADAPASDTRIRAIAKLYTFLLVPEIALTPAVAGQFHHRFGERVAILHSAFQDAERAQSQMAIAAQEIGRIVKVPGIGKKTAERLLLELKGRPVFAGAIASAAPAGVSDDVRQALLALGYNERETTEALRTLPPDMPVGEAIRQALRSLSRA